MKKILSVFVLIFAVVFCYGQDYWFIRDYMAEFYYGEERDYILSYNYHYEESNGSYLGLCRYASKEIILCYTPDRAHYWDKDFMGTVIHETIHAILHFRGLDYDADGHGVAFYNEAYKFSKLLKGSSIEMSTRDIVGGIYEAKLLQLHSKGLYTDEDKDLQKENAVKEKKEQFEKKNPFKIAENTIYFTADFLFNGGISIDIGGGFVSVFDIGGKAFYQNSILGAGFYVGLQLPLEIKNTPVTIVPQINLDLSANFKTSYDDFGSFFVDSGLSFRTQIIIEMFMIDIGYNLYIYRDRSFFIGVGYGVVL